MTIVKLTEEQWDKFFQENRKNYPLSVFAISGKFYETFGIHKLGGECYYCETGTIGEGNYANIAYTYRLGFDDPNDATMFILKHC